MSKQIRKIQVAVAMLFIACFFSAFTLKTFHHLEEHAEAFTCEQHDGIHFHSESESECCPVCDFFFSAFHNFIQQYEVVSLNFFNAVYSIAYGNIQAQFIAFLYSLRAPPF
ncbi:MAG: hypothetical protein SH857_14195 [Chitinophagales bacterium]|nr:hypothetical protein [Chitinophagales bacterium]